MNKLVYIAETVESDYTIVAGSFAVLDPCDRHVDIADTSTPRDLYLPDVNVMAGATVTIIVSDTDGGVTSVTVSSLNTDSVIYADGIQVKSINLSLNTHYTVLYCDGKDWIELEGYRVVV